MDLFFMFGARLPGTVLFKRNAEEIISIDYSNIEDKILDYSYDCLKCIQKKMRRGGSVFVLLRVISFMLYLQSISIQLHTCHARCSPNDLRDQNHFDKVL